MPDASAAADVVGAMLQRWHYVALLAPLVLLALEWRRARAPVLVLLFVALTFAAAQAVTDVQIRLVRQRAIVPISSLDRESPLRRRFGVLHGISSMLLLLQVAAAAAVVASE